MIVRYDPNRDCYTILGVSSLATREEIDRAFREAGRRLHPDKHLGREAEMTERFQRLSEAYQLLKDEETRRRYDEARRRYLTPQPEAAPAPAPPAPEEAAPAEEEAEEDAPYWRRRKYVYSVRSEARTRAEEGTRRRGGYFLYRDFFKTLPTFAALALATYAGLLVYAVVARDLEFAARHGVIEVIRWGGFAPGMEGSSDEPLTWVKGGLAALGTGGLIFGSFQLLRLALRRRAESAAERRPQR